MVELKDHQQEETEGKMQQQSRLILMERTFASLKVHNLKVATVGGHTIYSVTTLNTRGTASLDWGSEEGFFRGDGA